VDPAVAYQNYQAFNNGVQQNAFLKNANGSIYKGMVWPGVTAFPDWFAPGTQGYWNGEFDSFFSPTNGVDIDAVSRVAVSSYLGKTFDPPHLIPMLILITLYSYG